MNNGLCGEYQSKINSNLFVMVKYDAGIYLTVQNFIDTENGRAWLNKSYNMSSADLFDNYVPRPELSKLFYYLK